MKKFFVCIFVALAFLNVGCGDAGPDNDPSSGQGVAVIYESDLLADVQVRLHASPTGPIIAQAISASDGVARFTETPSPEPDQYFVSLASVSDGGWMLDAKFLGADNGIQLNPLATHAGQRIELPRGAVRLLTSSKPR
ncbi:MAG: hypothetical protein WBD31_28465 [Rubripirellula sp.]